MTATPLPTPRQRAPRITLATLCTTTGCGHAYSSHTTGPCAVQTCHCGIFTVQAVKTRARRTPRGRLSEAELRVVHEVARGGGRRQVAARLGLSPLTVKSVLRNATKAAGARSTAGLVGHAIRTGQLPADVAAGTEVTT